MRVRILLESLASARKKYGNAIVDVIKEDDPTPTFKYTEWLCGRYHLEDLNYAKEILTKFDKIHNHLEKKDIMQYTFAELKNVVENYITKKEKENLLRKIPKDAEKIYENDKAMVVRVDSYKASCFYGLGKFCIADTSGSRYWDDYKQNEDVFFYIIDKNDVKRTQVIQAKPEMQVSEKGELIGWNKENRQTYPDDILYTFNIDKKIFDEYKKKLPISKLNDDSLVKIISKLISNDNKISLDKLIESGVKINSPHLNTLLESLAMPCTASFEYFEILIQLGANVHSNGEQPLRWAITMSNNAADPFPEHRRKIINSLIKHGADIEKAKSFAKKYWEWQYLKMLEYEETLK